MSLPRHAVCVSGGFCARLCACVYVCAYVYVHMCMCMHACVCVCASVYVKGCVKEKGMHVFLLVDAAIIFYSSQEQC